MNIHNLSLFIIIEITVMNVSFYAAFSFQVGKNEENFIQLFWLLKRLYEYLNIFNPQIILTDYNLVLMNAIKVIFSNIINLLCMWHINMSVKK